MSAHPYTTLRSTTPPLYYRRPEGAPPSYYTVPAREVEGLRIPGTAAASSTTTAAPSTAAAPTTMAREYQPRPSVNLRPSADRSSLHRAPPASSAAVAPPPPPSPRLSGYFMPTVVNPYSHGAAPHPAAAHVAEPVNPTSYLQQANAMGRWSYQQQPPLMYQPPQQQQQQYPTVDPVAARVAAIDAEEAALAAEEAVLRAKVAELQMVRKGQEEEQLTLSQGWAQMLETEERYYTEPVVNLRSDIMAREQHCAMLRDHLQQVEAQAQHAQAQLQGTDYILRGVESFEQERKSVQDGFHDVERRRRACVARAERYFDVETQRLVEANRVIPKIEAQLRDMKRRGPLAELRPSDHPPPSSRRSASRVVTFAPDKSIVLDLGRDGSASSAEPVATTEGESGGVSSSYGSGHDSASLVDAGEKWRYGVAGFGEEEDIGGTSVAFSLNDSKQQLVKRRRFEVETA
ncbi:kinetoplastid kinetochore protein 8 [Novymonas esmeraldas]|uniref:Kinetoplastid kinetochore protein 8 n=1 Tax=Novymonas esmeraldas TaxID=1808958 RepID=A0AAW0F8G5_9TRYP